MIEEISLITQVDENWAQVENFSRYWISDLGRVYDTKLHKLSRIEVEYDGYLLVSLHGDNGEHKSKRIHRLVAEAFLADWSPEWPWTVNHINGIKSDNRLCNLEMLTAQDNSRHYQTASCFEESRKAARESASSKMKELCSTSEYHEQMSERMKKIWQDDSMRKMYVDCLYKRQSNPDNRKKVSDKLKHICSDPEYRRGMSERQKELWTNEAYRSAIQATNQDRVWVHDSTSEKWIHEYELSSYLESGYQLGRLPSNFRSSTAGKIRIYKGIQSKFVDPALLHSFFSEGWKLGKAAKRRVKCIETGQIYDSVEECASAFGTNADLIKSRCNGTAKNFRKLKKFHFCYHDEKEN